MLADLCRTAEVPICLSVCLGICIAPGALLGSSLTLSSHTAPSQGTAFLLMQLIWRFQSWQTAGMLYMSFIAWTVATQYRR